MKQQVVAWVVGGGLALVASAAARALPAPAEGSARVYVWFYNFAHALLANFDKLKGPNA